MIRSYTTHKPVKPVAKEPEHKAHEQPAKRMATNAPPAVEAVDPIVANFAQRQNDHNNRHKSALEIIASEVKVLNEMVNTMLTSAGEVSADDLVTLQSIEIKGEHLANLVEALAAVTPPRLTALA